MIQPLARVLSNMPRVTVREYAHVSREYYPFYTFEVPEKQSLVFAMFALIRNGKHPLTIVLVSSIRMAVVV